MLKYNTTIREIGPPSTQSMAHLGAFLQVFPGKVTFTARHTNAHYFSFGVKLYCFGVCFGMHN